MPKARIIKIISNQYTVFTEDGQRLLAIAMGKLRLKKSPVVGDWVLVDRLEDKWGIQFVEERFNELTPTADCQCRSGDDCHFADSTGLLTDFTRPADFLNRICQYRTGHRRNQM
jgi:putative ribosome biogenesis GTPase RsgA